MFSEEASSRYDSHQSQTLPFKVSPKASRKHQVMTESGKGMYVCMYVCMYIIYVLIYFCLLTVYMYIYICVFVCTWKQLGTSIILTGELSRSTDRLNQLIIEKDGITGGHRRVKSDGGNDNIV